MGGIFWSRVNSLREAVWLFRIRLHLLNQAPFVVIRAGVQRLLPRVFAPVQISGLPDPQPIKCQCNRCINIKPPRVWVEGVGPFRGRALMKCAGCPLGFVFEGVWDFGKGMPPKELPFKPSPWYPQYVGHTHTRLKVGRNLRNWSWWGFSE